MSILVFLPLTCSANISTIVMNYSATAMFQQMFLLRIWVLIHHHVSANSLIWVLYPALVNSTTHPFEIKNIHQIRSERVQDGAVSNEWQQVCARFYENIMRSLWPQPIYICTYNKTDRHYSIRLWFRPQICFSIAYRWASSVFDNPQ